MAEILRVPGGDLAYEVEGSGPLVVMAHGMGDSREAYRFLSPALVAAGYRVARMDLRGHGGSSATWDGYTRTAIAGDLLALVRRLGGPAVLLGHSISGGAVTIATADAPELVAGAVEIAPFTRAQAIRIGDFRNRAYRRGTLRLLATGLLGSETQWRKYLEVAYPGTKPPDWTARLDRITTMLSEPGRMKALQRMGMNSPADAGRKLPLLRRATLVIEGGADPDWASPLREGEAIVAEIPDGLARLVVIDGAGHYPHVQYPAETLAAITPFLREVLPTRA